MSIDYVNILISLIIGVIAGVIAEVVAYYIIEKIKPNQTKPGKTGSDKRNIRSAGRKIRSGKRKIRIGSIFLLVTLGSFGLLHEFVNPPSPIIKITEINDKPINQIGAPNPGIGFELKIKGHSSEPALKIYIVVKPLIDPFWYIQPPAPAQFIGVGNTDWVGKAYLGEARRGVGDDFTVFAVASSEEYGPEEKLDHEPRGTKSNSILLRRTQ